MRGQIDPMGSVVFAKFLFFGETISSIKMDFMEENNLSSNVRFVDNRLIKLNFELI